MSYTEISRVLGRYFLYLAGILVIPLGVAIFYEFIIDKTFYFSIPATFAFLATIAVCLLCSLLFQWFGRKAKGTLYRKEGIFLVVSIWFLTAAVGSCPFLMTKTIKNPIDAYFETMSGLTTTGASILYPKIYEKGKEVEATVPNPLDSTSSYTFYGTIEPLIDPLTGNIVKTGIEALGKPLLFWRSFLQWLGGMGIVVLFIAVLPALSMGGKFLYENEMAGISKEGITPRIKETASLLWKIYLGLTLFQVVLMKLTNSAMPFFDAIALSFTTISTGGFTVTNTGLLSYGGIATPLIISIFMIGGSINFTFYFHGLKGKFYRLYEPEFFLFLVILFFGCLLMSIPLWQGGASLADSLAQGSFMAISSQTTTGFSLLSYDLWPFVCQLLMLILMFIGGMSGSTTGGIKVIRYFIVLKLIKHKIESLFRPEVVRSLKVGDKEINPKTASTVLTFFCIVIFLVILGTYLLVWDNHDLVTAIGTISCMINNTGLSFGGIGSTESFAFLSPFSKIVCILWMVLGRLEYLSVLVLLVPAFWQKK
ncbi:MAG TPA: TrkH family potassium uptake protein [Rhabdochlamydiaceae bacterium]|nr:TrkH family potassium uptake protein [Rhabdochlamydiaceae bacterium]